MKKKGFTLIELLVVITIIGILAGLATPAIGGALDKANQTKDVNNIKQLGTIMFTDANDNNSRFRINQAGVTNVATASHEVFESLAADGTLNSLSVLGGTGVAAPADTSSITATTVAWDYVVKDATTPLTTQDSTFPLLFSWGALPAGNWTPAATINISARTTSTALWGNKGICVYYVGGNAAWTKAKSGSVTLDPVPNDTNATNTIFAR